MHLVDIGGYALLALLAIAAPTPLPVPLESIILGLIAVGYSPPIVIALALVGDIIGTVLIFVLGQKGRALLTQYKKRKKRKDYIIAEKLFRRFGKYALLLSGTPFLGDALIFLAGFYRMQLQVFISWFLLGKLLWYGYIIIPAIFLGRPLLSAMTN